MSGALRCLVLLAFVIFLQLEFYSVHGQTTQPLVAIHDSEYTRALEDMTATGATPTGPGTTGKQWWPIDWHYFVMPEMMKEALRSDGTAFTVVGDSNILAGGLLTNGLPRYPIVISLASEAIHDGQIAQFTNYVAAGGFLFIGSSAFTRQTNGTTRGNFAFADEMGVHMQLPGVTNFGNNSTYTRLGNHRINAHVPPGTISWRQPSSSEEIPYGVSLNPSQPHGNNQAQAPHDVWLVVNSNATVLAQGAASPFLTVKQYGNGYFIYCSALQPLLGNGGWAPTMYAYLTLRRSIEWAFENANLPVAKISPWPFQYDAAYMVRHDLESFANEFAAIEASAQFEFTNGCTGDYYICTGTLREDMSGTYNTNDVVASLRRAITNYGAIIGPHNGGLTNPMIAGTPASYDYWHWGPDEVLDITPPPGFSSGSNYAYVSMSRSFDDIESWLSGLMTNGMRVWCAPYYNGTREGSLNIQSHLGVKITGEQKLAPFPHWTLSTQVPNKRFSILQQPPSDWFVGSAISHSTEASHTIGTLRAGIDFYYNLGALVNFYSHTLSTGLGPAGSRATEYVTYSMNTNRFPRLWSANAIKIYDWWLQRSNMQISVSHTNVGLQSQTTFLISNSIDTNNTVELFAPATSLFCDLKIFTNGVLASTNIYRISGQTIKVKVGTTVTNALVTYFPYATAPFYTENFDAGSPPALPATWSSSDSGGATSPWTLQSSLFDSATNAAFVPGANNFGESSLISPVYAMPSGPTRLSFRHRFDLEAGVGGVASDAAVLEIKIGTNNFTDIVTAGGSFVSGGYAYIVATGFGNPLAGRQAWSGISGGFIPTLVNLPANVSGQNVQFRWRSGFDSGNASVGWYVDSISVNALSCLCCSGGTNNPVLPAQTNRNVLELNTLSVTNAATDADLPNDALFYYFSTAPVGASLSSAGIITWTPTEAQGPSTNLFTTVATDSTGRSATNSFTVTVLDTNSAPVLTAQSNRTINELTPLTVTNTATDTDLPTNSLAYSLLVAPAGASISTVGIITWNPDETQGPGVHTFTTRVVDNGTPNLSATNTFTVTVTEVNLVPTLPGQSDRTIGELVPLTVTNTATDLDQPANVLTYQLLTPPAGAAINASGIITWTPSAIQGPTTNLIRTVVTDNGTPAFSATNSFLVIVTDTANCQFTNLINQNFDGVTAPVLPVGWTTSNSGAQSLWVNQSLVSDSAPNALFASEAAAVGTSDLISPTVTLSEGQALLSFRHSYNLENENAVLAYDGGVLEIQIGTNIFQDIIIAGGSFVGGGYTHTIDDEFNSPIMNRAAWSGNSGGFTNTVVALPASAANQPIQLRWRCATDSALAVNGWYVDNIVLSNLVCSAGNNSNSAPTLPAQTNRTIAEGDLLSVTNTASDANLPSETLSYALVNPPGGASINTSGIITWIPGETQGSSTNAITTIVTDGGGLSATNSFAVIVTEANQAPILPAQTNRTIVELALVTITNAATDADLPPNVLTYSLLTAPSGVLIDANTGVITWTPTEAQGPSISNAIVTRVIDNGIPPLSATNTFYITVTETNNHAPILSTQVNRTIAELTVLTVTNAATDADLPANTLTYQLLNPPGNAAISINGIITWTPQEIEGPTTNTLTTVVSDGGLTATNTFQVIVTEVNQPPTLPAQNNRTIAELELLSVTNTATDADLPANNLTYQLLNPPTNAQINPSGVINWRPSVNQGPSSNVFTTVVNDGTASATNTFAVIVNDTLIGLTTNLTLVSTGAVWKYLDDGSDQGSTWRNIGYNDTSWTNGPAQLGYGDGDEATVVSFGPNSNAKFITTYFRRAFSIADRTFFSALNLRALRDDGIIVYLNGTEVYRSNMPAGSINYLTLASGNVGGVNETTFFSSSIDPELLVNGTNVIAVEVHQDLPSSTDLSFDFELTGVLSLVAPTLPALTNRTHPELTTLTVTNTAADLDSLANTLSYQLLNPPGNAAINLNGIITWTPQENEGPGSGTITTVVTDGMNSFTNSFLVTVTEVNQAPVLPIQTNRTITELTLLTVANTASDADLPANALTYQLFNAPAGMNISATGVITWTPAETAGPSTNTITTVVNDGTQSATNGFLVVVSEANTAPTLNAIANRIVHAGSTVSFVSVAEDDDLPAQQLSFSLINTPPAGATINPANGSFNWLTTSANINSTNTVTVQVSDNGIPVLGDTTSFVITVVARPQIQSIVVTNNVAAITWSSIAGQIYRLQRTDSLTPPNWQDVGTDLTATTNVTIQTNSVPGITGRFYRVRLAP